MGAIVELEGVSKHFGAVVAVEHVDLAVQEGEFLTLLGPSGCGKSTLLRMIGGFEQPTRGLIRLGGRDVTHLPPQKREVNMMFQDYALFPHMTVGRNIAYGLRMKGLSRGEALSQARAALELVGLPEKIDQYPHQLSGGQRQRVALARAIVRRPKVLLLDEPMSALDAKLREQMQIELKHLHERIGITFIMVTHDQTEALVMSDRIVVMNEGRIAQQGTPEDLYERPRTPHVADFIGAMNLHEVRVLGAEGDVLRVSLGGQELRLRAERPPAGPTARIGVRPEKARIVNGAPRDGANLLSGTVVEHIYHGTSLRTVLRLPGGEDFLVDRMLPVAMERNRPAAKGEQVRIEIAPENILLFDAEDRGGPTR